MFNPLEYVQSYFIIIFLLHHIRVILLLVSLGLVELLNWNIVKFVHQLFSLEFLVISLVTSAKEIRLAQSLQNYLRLLRSIHELWLVHLGVSLSFSMVLNHHWRCRLLINWLLLLLRWLLLWPHLEQIIVFFVDVAYLPVVTYHHLRMVVALDPTILQTAIH